MKKVLILVAATFIIYNTGKAQTTFGIKGGINSNYTMYKATNEDDDEKYEGSNTGFHIGGLANVSISDKFIFQPNLLFSMKGGAISGAKITTYHVDIPLNFLYTEGGFFIGGGPNFSYGLSGKIDAGDEDLDIFDQEDAGSYTLKKFEIGTNVLMGYTLPNGLFFSASFTPGLNDIYEGEEGNTEDITAHSKQFGFSIGYFFGKKK